jgi:hypothetical protein
MLPLKAVTVRTEKIPLDVEIKRVFGTSPLLG